MPAAARLAERLRRDARPRRRRRSGSARTTSMVPAGRRYLPGTPDARDDLETRDRLADRARRAADRVRGTTWTSARTTHRRSPTDFDAEHVPAAHRHAASAARSTCRWTASRCSTTAGRRPAGRTRATATARSSRRPRAATSTLRLTTDLRLGLRGPAAHARGPRMSEGDSHFVRAVVVDRMPPPRRYDEAVRAAAADRASTGAQWLDRGDFPDHPWRELPAAQRADAQGPDLRADRRAARRGDDVAARDARRRAQLGLPLHLDPRLDVRAVGPVHARLRLGGRRLLLLHRRRVPRRTTTCRSCTASAASASSTEEHARPPDRLRGRAPGADRQRRLRPAAARRLGRAARLGLPAHAGRATSCPRRSGRSSSARSRRRSSTGSEPDRGIWEVRGEPKHFTSSKLMCWVAAGPRRAAGAACATTRARPSEWQAVADEIHDRHLRERRRRPRRLRAALRDRRAGRLAAAAAARALPAAGRPARSGRPCWRSPTS